MAGPITVQPFGAGTSDGIVRINIFASGGSIVNPFQNPMTTAGDMIYGGVSGAPLRLPANTNGQILTLVSGNPSWVTPSFQAPISLTTTGNNGASTLVSNILNIPTYTLVGLGGQPQLNGTGFIKASGTTITYDPSVYITSSALANEMMKSNGTNAAGSSLYSSSAGNLNFGINTLAGSERTLLADGNAGNVALTLTSKGSASIYVNSLSGDVTLSLGNPSNLSTNRLLTVNGSSSNINLNILAQGTGSILVGGAASSSNSNLDVAPSAIKLNLPFQLFISNTNNIPASNPIGGIYTYVDAGVWKWRDSSGNIYPLNVVSNPAQGVTNEVQKNNAGAFAGAAFTSSGNLTLTLGLSGTTTGSSRIITCAGNTSNIDLVLQGAGTGQVTIGASFLNLAGSRIIGVAAGVNPTDAVNISQITAGSLVNLTLINGWSALGNFSYRITPANRLELSLYLSAASATVGTFATISGLTLPVSSGFLYFPCVSTGFSVQVDYILVQITSSSSLSLSYINFATSGQNSKFKLNGSLPIDIAV